MVDSVVIAEDENVGHAAGPASPGQVSFEMLQDSAPTVKRKKKPEVKPEVCIECAQSRRGCRMVPSADGEIQKWVCATCSKYHVNNECHPANKREPVIPAPRERKSLKEVLDGTHQGSMFHDIVSDVFEYYTANDRMDQKKKKALDQIDMLIDMWCPYPSKKQASDHIYKSLGTISPLAQEKVAECISAARTEQDTVDSFENEKKGHAVLLELPQESGFIVSTACTDSLACKRSLDCIMKDAVELLRGTNLGRVVLNETGRVEAKHQIGSVNQPVVLLGWLSGALDYDPSLPSDWYTHEAKDFSMLNLAPPRSVRDRICTEGAFFLEPNDHTNPVCSVRSAAAGEAPNCAWIGLYTSQVPRTLLVCLRPLHAGEELVLAARRLIWKGCASELIAAVPSSRLLLRLLELGPRSAAPQRQKHAGAAMTQGAPQAAAAAILPRAAPKSESEALGGAQRKRAREEGGELRESKLARVPPPRLPDGGCGRARAVSPAAPAPRTALDPLVEGGAGCGQVEVKLETQDACDPAAQDDHGVGGGAEGEGVASGSGLSGCKAEKGHTGESGRRGRGEEGTQVSQPWQNVPESGRVGRAIVEGGTAGGADRKIGEEPEQEVGRAAARDAREELREHVATLQAQKEKVEEALETQTKLCEAAAGLRAAAGAVLPPVWCARVEAFAQRTARRVDGKASTELQVEVSETLRSARTGLDTGDKHMAALMLKGVSERVLSFASQIQCLLQSDEAGALKELEERAAELRAWQQTLTQRYP